jgi:receptor protein-tyrosine kinase
MTEENPDKSAGANSGRSRSLVERAAGKMLLDPLRAPPESAKPPVATPTSAGVSLVDAAQSPEPQVAPLQPNKDGYGRERFDPQRQPYGADQAAAGGQKNRESKFVKIDLAGLASRNLLSPETKRSRTGEEFRLIKRRVLSRRWSPGVAFGNTVMVTSALPGEGKTTVSINLAISIAAEKDLRVVLVDADFVKPDALRRLGVTADKGLIDVMEDPRMDISDIMFRTDIDKLSLIPAGKLHPRCTELLASARMNEIVAELANRYADRILIFDSPPVLATTESVALASHMGQIVFVIQAERTRRKLVDSALELLGDRENVGLVLNRATPKMGNTEFGYHYSGYYYEQSGEAKTSA